MAEFRTDRVYRANAGETPRGSKYHWSPDGDLVSACGRTVLLEDSEEDPSDTLRSERCGAPGCRQRWLGYFEGAGIMHKVVDLMGALRKGKR